MVIEHRQNRDLHGGTLVARCLGAPIIRTEKKWLNRLPREYLNEGVSGGLEMDDYGHNDLIIEEYTKASVCFDTLLKVDWKYGDDNAT
jgi:hypothetical protein